MLKILIAIILVVGVGCGDIWGMTPATRNDMAIKSGLTNHGTSDLPMIDDPDVLKVYIVRDGTALAIVALQNEDGQWVVGFTDIKSQSYYLGNETGAVKIT